MAQDLSSSSPPSSTDSRSPETTAPKPSPFGQRRREIAVAPRVDWYQWRDWFGGPDGWLQDQHISLIGPNGTGKSALACDLLDIRKWVVYCFTKPEDKKLTGALQRKGYVVVPAFPRQPPDDVDRYLLWPAGSGGMDPESHDQQQLVLRDAFYKIFNGPGGGAAPGRWCICLDEARYVADPSYLGLRREVNQLLIQGRSLKIACVLNFQRPSWVPPEAYDQASHLFIANDNDRRNVQRFREIGGVDGDQLAVTVQQLEMFEWAHVDARPGRGTIQIIRMPKGL